MKKNIIFIVIGAISIIVLFSGCATTRYDLSPVLVKKNMKKLFYNDREIVFCEGKKANLFMYGFREGSELFVYPGIYNKLQKEYLNVVPDQIEVYGVNEENKLLKLHNYTAKEYMAKQRSKQAWSQFFVALSGALNAAAAANSTTYSSGYSHSTGTYGGYGFSANTYGSSVSKTYDYSKSLAVQAQTNQQLDNMRAQNEYANQELDNCLLKKNSIGPQCYAEGYVVAEIDGYYNSKYFIIVPINGEKFKFLFEPISEQ